MTNNWTDMGNSSLVVVMGANPVENHPASMAHINRARDNGARLIVIDPRKTRTALQCKTDGTDRYVRIRPGTDIAFINGIMRGVIAEMESRPVGDATRDKFYEFLNQGDDVAFMTDGDATTPSQSADVPDCSKYTDARCIMTADGSDYERHTIVASTGLPAGGGEPANTVISDFPKRAADVFSDSNTVYNRLKAHVDPYDTATVADICGCSEADIQYVIDAYIDNGRCSSVGAVTGAASQDPTVAGYKATTMLYAMGLTQHTCGGQNVKSFATLQSLMGNVGRAGGGINALRGIHNVQGSTDMGNLFHLIPFYSGNPTTMTSGGVTVPNDADAFGKYMDGLWGVPLSGTGGRSQMDDSYDDAYNPSAMGLQQWGFRNMTRNFFGDYGWSVTRSETNELYDLWPKGNGDNHIAMFRQAIAGVTKAMVVWGQNPAITEPNQSKIRDGLYNLDTLVVVDLFETETAGCDRKPTGTTYLIPASSYVEEAGSVANSGRVLQWRERATLPVGNTLSDMELLFRFAYALDQNGAFSHITDTWTAQGRVFTSAYDTLYGSRYGWTPGGGSFETTVSGTADIWQGDDDAPTQGTVYGSEWICELMYREMCTITTGTSWLYVDGYSTTRTSRLHPNQANWLVDNRSKSRDNADPNDTLAYPGWGYAWLVNRRVLYNNKDIPFDASDGYQGPEKCARLFVTTNADKGRALNYANSYRFYHRLSDKPDTCLVSNTMPHVLPGRFPGHTEPYETPREDLATTWGRNTRGNAAWELVPTDTEVAGRGTGIDPDASEFPFVLTTIRCVEHFQGGPITRNNPWNVETEPEPWIEINSLDAQALGIKDGDWVDVITARSNSTTDQEARTTGAPFAEGFRARVGVGLQSNQRVGRGVVAIPWHWGDRGLSTGSRANDLCIDAGDANTTIPESKACLCKLELA